MNTIVLMGRLARDPETKLASTQKGQTKVSRFPLVVKRNRTSKAFVVMITAYGNNAEFVEKYLEKGIKIALSGELVISQIKVEQTGTASYYTEVIMDDGNYIENDKISVCVDAVQVGDNLQLLGQNNVPEEWTDAVGTDGNLENNTLSYIKSGNGIDSVDEIVKTESVKQKLVYATVTYTNKSDEEINHMLYIGTLLLMDHEDRAYQIYDPTEQSGDDYDRVIWDGVARTAEMTYNSISEDYGDGGNYISSLKPGESIQVNMAWIVNENDLNNMYLNLNGDGAAYEFSDSMLKTGLVDIYQ
ncbi:single-stranded DNA-binding protein [Blautia sp. OF03-15BH]|uniref:single-stranded DNA-binding protein n=1 Tax=Blautia sp. OF03-15BH TaxID=2292287 RepID=UPI000E4F2850|nr:single-stranded DNA-binding protein [Blautia sp. OF03-15BH]RGX96803.1 single-stranded DNA-binding protein [Blautia sp. OF03-15BH]